LLNQIREKGQRHQLEQSCSRRQDAPEQRKNQRSLRKNQRVTEQGVNPTSVIYSPAITRYECQCGNQQERRHKKDQGRPKVVPYLRRRPTGSSLGMSTQAAGRKALMQTNQCGSQRYANTQQPAPHRNRLTGAVKTQRQKDHYHEQRDIGGSMGCRPDMQLGRLV